MKPDDNDILRAWPLWGMCVMFLAGAIILWSLCPAHASPAPLTCIPATASGTNMGNGWIYFTMDVPVQNEYGSKRDVPKAFLYHVEDGALTQVE